MHQKSPAFCCVQSGVLLFMPGTALPVQLEKLEQLAKAPCPNPSNPHRFQYFNLTIVHISQLSPYILSFQSLPLKFSPIDKLAFSDSLPIFSHICLSLKCFSFQCCSKSFFISCLIMGFPMDPRMQRIIDNASANVQDDVYPMIPFSHANTLPPAQSTFSRHFSNGSNLQDVFSFRPSQQQIPRQPQYGVDAFGKLL